MDHSNQCDGYRPDNFGRSLLPGFFNASQSAGMVRVFTGLLAMEKRWRIIRLAIWQYKRIFQSCQKNWFIKI